MLLVGMIGLVTILVAFINRKLIISKLNCGSSEVQISDKLKDHDDSMMPVNKAIKKKFESRNANHDEVFLTMAPANVSKPKEEIKSEEKSQ